jgi:Fur family ferric uptake transcriptional regulator
MTTAPERQPLAFASIDDIAAALRDAGHRVSAPARLVLDALFVADGPVSAERIADGLGGRLRPLDVTSVYRNLERLEALGVVSHVHLGHGPGLYALSRGGEHEYLVCESCGRVTRVERAALDPVRETVRRAFGYRARFSHFPIHGQCADCTRAGESTSQSRAPTPRHAGSPAPGEEHAHGHAHAHGEGHGGVLHRHPHPEHDHEHSHGDRVHAHPHVHRPGIEHDHGHGHAEDA